MFHLQRLDEHGIAYRLQEHHFKGDAYRRDWDLNWPKVSTGTLNTTAAPRVRNTTA
jgi:hypothetical protein